MSSAGEVKVRLERIRASVSSAAERAGRDPSEICLVAVSKRHPPEAIRAAYDAGQRDFGENYAQEMRDKQAALADRCPDIRWHFIGRVQTNKAQLLSSAQLVHGVGSARQLAAVVRRGPVDALLQVNVGLEEQKNGFSPNGLREDFQALEEAGSGHIKGLMTMPPAEAPEAARVHFAELRALRDELRARYGAQLPYLSMGMSADFEQAIAEGATHVRVGTAIFGPRPAG